MERGKNPCRLGFSNDDMQRDPMQFSGGYRLRPNLAKVLVSEPDLLILDEPTNYLDITSIRWILRFLITWPREVLLVTRDRGFMDDVVTHIVGIHRRKMRKIQGYTSKYYLQNRAVYYTVQGKSLIGQHGSVQDYVDGKAAVQRKLLC